MNPHPAIELRGLVKTYPRFTLGPIDLSVPRGAIYGLIGPNGAGKTTAIDLIFGLGRNDAGTIRVLGLDHRADEVSLKRRVAYVSPELNFATWGKVGKAIRFVRGFYPGWDDAYCADPGQPHPPRAAAAAAAAAAVKTRRGAAPAFQAPSQHPSRH